jgi:hypothetical protein
LGGSTLDDGAVGERVAEGNAHFNHGDTSFLHGEDDIGSAFERGATSTEIKGKEFLILVIREELIDFIHNDSINVLS